MSCTTKIIFTAFCILSFCISCSTTETKRKDTLEFRDSYDVVYKASILSLTDISFIVKSSDKDAGIIYAEAGRNFITQNSSPQLNIIITENSGIVEVNISAIQPGQIIDYGASAKNIKKFKESLIKRLVK